ncbi:MAG: ribosome recycling factor [Proteobacteria bacterium]|nr:ribosome recycling factor [Pseudomonadota bacterium]
MNENPAELLSDIKKRMDGAFSACKHSLSGLRTGRASSALLDPIRVNIHNTSLPINQLGTVNTPESRLLTIKAWDKSNLRVIANAISNAGLGLNPMIDADIIRIQIPDLSEERRLELAKKAKEYGENAKVAVRNVRKDAMNILKRMEKEVKLISEDERIKYEKDIQKLTDESILEIDTLVSQKSDSILTI